MNYKVLPVLLSASLGALGGFVIGRVTAPDVAKQAGSSRGTVSSVEGEIRSIAGRTESGEAAQADGLKGPVPKPISPAELQTELSSLEDAGYFGMSSLRQMADLQDRLKVSDIAGIAAGVCSSPLTSGRETGLHLVMATYAEKDPQGAWNLAMGMKEPQGRQSALMAVISAVAAKDPTRAMAMTDGIGDVQLRRQVRSMAVMNIARQDPQRALGLALEGGNPGEQDYSVSMIFHQWARKDPEGAKAAITRLSGRQAEQARMTLVSALTQSDPKAAWDYALSLPFSGTGYQDARVQVVQQWAQGDPQSALKAALSISDPSVRGSAIGAAVSSWARNDFSGALKYAVSVEDSTVRADILRTLGSNSQGNRAELLSAVLDHMPPGDNFQQAVSGIFSNWARENPAEAAAAISQLPPGRVLSTAANQIASQWIRNTANKKEVLDWARNLPEGEARENSLRSVFGEWSTTDPGDALRALDTLPPADRQKAAQALASGWSRRDPEAALQWASSLTNSDERNAVVRTSVSQWANFRPDAAASYVQRLPEAERTEAMQAVVDSWASKDTEAAAAWLDRQPAGPAKDASLGSLARKIAQEDPEAALTWVMGISNDNQRLYQTESVVRDWLRQDPAAARQWISTSSLPEDVRTRLRR